MCLKFSKRIFQKILRFALNQIEDRKILQKIKNYFFCLFKIDNPYLPGKGPKKTHLPGKNHLATRTHHTHARSYRHQNNIHLTGKHTHAGTDTK